MDDAVDYYADLRSSPLNAALGTGLLGVRGQLDASNSNLLFHPDVSQSLASESGAAIELGEPGSPVVQAFATYLHETVHWWQHIGTAVGMFCGLSVPTQAIATIAYLDRVGDAVPKPILRNLSADLADDHPAVLAATRWLEVEYGSTFLGDHAPLVAKARQFDYFVSAGYSLIMLYANTVAALNFLFDPDGNCLPSIDHFIDRHDRFAGNAFPDFVPGNLRVPRVSTVEILEGQARVIEAQYRTFTYEPLTWRGLREAGYFAGVYAKAFDVFLAVTEFEEPAEAHDAVVDLFLLICDIALNPGEGYADEIPADSNFVEAVHPGYRFERLCAIARSNPDLMGKRMSLAAYTEASEYLCRSAGWDTPVVVWQKVLDRTGRMPGVPELDRQWQDGSLTAEHVPVRFYLAQHRDILETRVQIPHFFCWPVYFLVDLGGNPQETREFGEVLNLHQPPFLSSSLTNGVDTCQIPHFTPDQRADLLSDYFRMQVMYDLMRQWMSRRGPFEMEYAWKPSLADSDREALSENFEAIFGRFPGDIPVA